MLAAPNCCCSCLRDDFFFFFSLNGAEFVLHSNLHCEGRGTALSSGRRRVTVNWRHSKVEGRERISIRDRQSPMLHPTTNLIKRRTWCYARLARAYLQTASESLLSMHPLVHALLTSKREQDEDIKRKKALLQILASKVTGPSIHEIRLPIAYTSSCSDHIHTKAVLLVTSDIEIHGIKLTRSAVHLFPRASDITVDSLSHWALCVVDRGPGDGQSWCYDLVSDQIILNMLGKSYARAYPVTEEMVTAWNSCSYMGETTHSHDEIKDLGACIDRQSREGVYTDFCGLLQPRNTSPDGRDTTSSTTTANTSPRSSSGLCARAALPARRTSASPLSAPRRSWSPFSRRPSSSACESKASRARYHLQDPNGAKTR